MGGMAEHSGDVQSRPLLQASEGMTCVGGKDGTLWGFQGFGVAWDGGRGRERPAALHCDFVSGYPSHFPSTSLAIPAPSLTGPASSDL